MDTMTKEQRHRCMAAIHSKGTKPERVVRRWLFARGYRFRLNHKRLPGHPDLVLRKYRTVIFVNGCFWHGHEGCGMFRLPHTNTQFWLNKIERNRQRDHDEQQRLAEMGWHCITIWECQLKPAVLEQTMQAVALALNQAFLDDRRVRRTYGYALPDERPEVGMAAEPEVEPGP